MKIALVIAGIVALCSAAGAQTADLVKAELVADTQAMEPGKPFQIALHLTIVDGWHVYWINPGDAGAPTTLKLTLPKGFTAGPMQYPVPEKMSQPENLTVYAYEHELLLTETVTPPADLAGSTFTISANAGWCVCNPEKCVIGRKDLSLNLPVSAGHSQSANQDLFAAWASRMPRSSEDAFSKIEYRFVPGEIASADGFLVTFNWRGTPPASEFEWIAGANDDLTQRLGMVLPYQAPNKTAVELSLHPIQGIPPSSSTVTGILAYHIQGQARGLAVTLDRKQLNLPVPADPAAPK